MAHFVVKSIFYFFGTLAISKGFLLLSKQSQRSREPRCRGSLLDLILWYARRDSNPRTWLRRPALYPTELRAHLRVNYSPPTPRNQVPCVRKSAPEASCLRFGCAACNYELR